MSNFGQPKLYPNLNPAAAIPVDREQIFSLRSFADNYRMSRGKEHGHYVPNSRFVFVTMMSGETLMHQSYRHPAISAGKPVLYAGEAYFNNGRLQWWSNGSGNYRPDPDHAAQSGLPMKQFYPYEQILKGTHSQPRSESITGAMIHSTRSANNATDARIQAKFAMSSPGWGHPGWKGSIAAKR
jgi:hypothetical protein